MSGRSRQVSRPGSGGAHQLLGFSRMEHLTPDVTHWAHVIARVIEAVGIGVMVLGGVIATMVFAWNMRGSFDRAYRCYREHLGRAILLGLEFMVAADIIGTVAVEPSFSNLGVLGLIVLIRTFLSFSLEVEINGRWPWQSPER